MAKKKDEKIILENVELKPQVLGYTFQKKTNVIRVIIIFIAFILVVYFIDDISLFFNNLLGRETPSTIVNNANNNSNNNNETNETENEENVEYYSYNDELSINFEKLTFDTFKINNNSLTFDVNNLSSETIDLSNENIFLETYDTNKNLIDIFKLDIDSVANNSKINLNLNIQKPFEYLTIKTLEEDDYPALTLESNENGESTITCNKDKETITYTFKDASLIKINHNIINNDVNDVKYTTDLRLLQNKINDYKKIEGIEATFSSSLTGYNADINLDLAKVDLSKINENNYYYAYHKDAKVIKYEMPAYGFKCN